MPRNSGLERLRLDLAAARRARTTITDPMSVRMLGDYISELENELHCRAMGAAVGAQAAAG